MSRKTAIELIKISGYHQDGDWVRVYCENRISRQVADKAYQTGYQMKMNGVKCNCLNCKGA
ncbi:MAG: hypothetical protein GY861_03825 [bacterium]|nr:hypothetical protein [bacterium]